MLDTPALSSRVAFKEAVMYAIVRSYSTGTDESSRRAAEWVNENIGATANPPVITEGGTVAHFSS